MAYPPPPGTNSLPARPPASNSRPGFKSAFGSANQTATPPSYAKTTPSIPNAASYYPSNTTASQDGQSYPSYPNRPPAGVNSSASTFSYPQHQQQNQQQNQHQHQYQHQNQYQQQYQQQHQSQPQSYGQQSYSSGGSSYATAPRIQNPFPTPGTAGSDVDPDMAAQIAQWQSAYIPREPDKDGKPLPATEYPKAEVPDPNAKPDKKKTVAREGGGKKWTDDTLLEWDPSHLRLFVGNLAGETTDESLLKAFSRWKSVQKARVIRDKRTTKSKGYGFVSFSDADDFFQAAKEMHGKYIQSHPVVVKKANTEIKVTNVKEKNQGGKRNNKGRDQNGGGYEPHLGPRPGGGVTKPGQKTKNGLRLLG